MKSLAPLSLIFSLFFCFSFHTLATECSEIQGDNTALIKCERADEKVLKEALGGCPVVFGNSHLSIYNPICLDQVLERKIKSMKDDYLTAFAYLLPEQRKNFFTKCAQNERYDHILQCLHDLTPSQLSSTKNLFGALAKTAKSLMINQYLSVTSRNDLCFKSKDFATFKAVSQAAIRIKSQLPFHCNPLMDAKEYIKFKTNYLKLLFAQYLDHPQCLDYDQCSFVEVGIKVEPKYFSTTISPPITHKYRDGFVFEPWKNLTDDEVRAKFQILKDSGAGHVTLLVHLCQKSIRSNTPGDCGNFEAELDKKMAWAKVAKSLGLTFDITPFPYALTESGAWEWRGKFRPTSVDKWFQGYTKIVRTITQRAFDAGAIYQVVATEMSSLHKYTRHWINLASNLRGISNRPLVMNVSWFEVPHMFWKAFDVIGVSAYYPIAITPSSSVKTMTAAWKIVRAKLNILSKLYGKPYQFTEVGYPSANYGAMLPSLFNYEGRDVDMEEQRRAFKAFRTVWQSDKKLIRALIWATDAPEANLDRSQDKTYDPFNKPAIEEVKMFFKHRNRL